MDYSFVIRDRNDFRFLFVNLLWSRDVVDRIMDMDDKKLNVKEKFVVDIVERLLVWKEEEFL